MTENVLDRAAFAKAVGVGTSHLGNDIASILESAEMRFDALTDAEREELITSISKRIESETWTPSGPARRPAWEKGWRENLEGFIESGYDLDALNPRFLRPNQNMRWGGDFVKVRSPRFELDFFRAYRRWIFRTYLQEASDAYEFGCGTGFNLVDLAEVAPSTRLVGLDWASSAVELVNLLGDKLKLPMRGQSFDFFNPDNTVILGNKAAVFTMCALEQTGAAFGPFLKYLVD